MKNTLKNNRNYILKKIPCHCFQSSSLTRKHKHWLDVSYFWLQKFICQNPNLLNDFIGTKILRVRLYIPFKTHSCLSIYMIETFYTSNIPPWILFSPFLCRPLFSSYSFPHLTVFVNYDSFVLFSATFLQLMS